MHLNKKGNMLLKISEIHKRKNPSSQINEKKDFCL